MKIISVSLDNGKDSSASAKEVTVEKKRNQYRFIKARKIGVSDLSRVQKAGNYKLTLDESDVVSSEIELPPIRDKGALNLLVKKRLVEILSDSREYSFIINENTVPVNSDTPAQLNQPATPKKKYNIFALSADYLNRHYVPDSYASKLNIVTLDPFALAALSMRVDPKAFICHVFTDEKKIIMTFSKGENQIYFRTTYIPDDISSENEINTFYMETINLTYLYVRQNRQEEVTKIILSGSIHSNSGIIDMVEQLTSFKAVILRPDHYISNIDMRTFQEYMLAIGAVLVDDGNNFLPPRLREQRAYSNVLIKLNMLSLLVLIVVGVLASEAFFRYISISSDLKKRSDNLVRQLSALSPTFSDKDSLIYDDTYINLLESRYDTPITILYDSQELLAKDTYKSLLFYMDNGKPALKAENMRTFSTYSATYNFQQYYLDQLRNLTNVSVTGGAALTLPERVYSMDTEILKGDN